MKRKYLLVNLLLLSSFGLFACGKQENSGNQTKYINVDPLEIEGFNKQYLPVKDKILK